MSSLLESLNWRYATKKFDSSKKLTDEQLNELLAALRLSASSYGLQPYKFFVISNTDIRKDLRTAAFDQSQITDASHVLVLCAKTTMDEAYIDHYIDVLVAERGMTREALQSFRDMMVGAILSKPESEIADWMKRQTEIALGFLLSAAASLRIDACPMEGFDAAKVDEILDLKSQGLTVVVLCPVGFRATDDTTAQYKKVRFPETELFVRKL